MELQLPAYDTATAMWNKATSVIYTTAHQLMAMPDPQTTEQGQGLIPYPHGWILVRFVSYYATMGTPSIF